MGTFTPLIHIYSMNINFNKGGIMTKPMTKNLPLSEQAIEEIEQLIRDLQNDIKGIEPMSSGKYKDVYLSIKLGLDRIKEEEDISIDLHNNKYYR